MSDPIYHELQLPADDDSYTGIIAILTAGETLAFGYACYLKAADSKMYKAVATATGTMPCIALALGAMNANDIGRFLVLGFIRDNAWSWTVNGLFYAHTTGGLPTQTRPAASGNQVQVIGVAMTSAIILFNPSYELVQVA